MKNILLATTILTLASACSAADYSEHMENTTKNNYYIKLGVGTNKVGKVIEHNYAYDNRAFDKPDNKSVSEVSPVFTLGIGKYINDYIRTEVAFENSSITFKNSKITHLNSTAEKREHLKMMTFPNFDNEEQILEFVDTAADNLIDQIVTIDCQLSEVRRKASINAVMLNNYVDFPIAGKSKLFLGAGVGVAQIKETMTQQWNLSYKEIDSRLINHISPMAKRTSKSKVNFAYSLTAGVSLPLNDKTNLDISYNWKDYGKTHHKNDVTNNRYRSHSAMASLRFDI